MATELFPALPTRVASIGKLGADMTSGAGTLTLAAAVPAKLRGTGQFRIMIDDEIMLATNADASTTLTIALRATEGTSGASHSRDTHIYYVLTAGALLNLSNPLRSSDVSTMERALAQTQVTLTSGTAYGRLAAVRSPNSYSRIRFATGNAGASVTGLRSGVWDSSTGRLLGETADLSGSFALSTLFEVSLASPVALVEGQTVLLGLGSVAGTAVTVRGHLCQAQADGVSPALGKSATGYTAGASLPALTGGAQGIAPWIELIP